jgi:hypothetical protein
MTALKKKLKATKCSDHRTINLIEHIAKIVARVIGIKIERKMVDILGENYFGFNREKETGDAIWMLRIMKEWALEMEKKLYAFFADWQKVFYRVKWTKITQILNETTIDWRKKRLINTLYLLK